VRAYASIADDLSEAGYSETQIVDIKDRVNRHVKLREIIRQASGETIDLKAYEADMRHLIDTYIEADEPRKISDFGEVGLLDLIVKSGIAEAINNLPKGIRNNKNAVAETIGNNVRSKIIKERLSDPAYYDKMSALLNEVLADLKAQRISYEEFLSRIAELAKKVQTGVADDAPEPLKKSPALRAVYNNLKAITPADILAARAAEKPEDSDTFVDPCFALALQIDKKIKQVRADSWRGNRAKENVIKDALMKLLNDENRVEQMFLIIAAQKEY